MRSVLLALGLFLVQSAPVQLPQDSGSIEGYVVTIGTRTPVIRARMEIESEDGSRSSIQSVITDTSGGFVFRNLRPGRYRVSAQRDGYMPAQYGERRRGAQGVTLTVGPRETLKNIVLSLTPKSAISGRVYDRYGDPVTNAVVRALRYTYQDGRRILVNADVVRTNDLGEYRIFWLAPTQYIVSATPQEKPGGPDSPQPELPTYFPGTTDVAAAALIDVQPGRNMSGIDLQMSELRAVRLRGQVIDEVTGQTGPRALVVTLVPRRGTVATTAPPRSVAVSPNGTFEVRQISPGSYDLVASDARASAHLAIDVGNSDIDNIVLTLLPKFDISGHITGENLENVRGIHVELRREPFTPQLLVAVPPVAADGTFTLANITPGDYQLRVGFGGSKGYVKSARYGAIDALNAPFRIDRPSQGLLEIVVSANVASVDAIVLNDQQEPFPDATVVLVPDPPRRQRSDLYRAVGSDSSGRVHLDGLAPDAYHIFAWDDVPNDAWYDPDFITTFEARGKPVRLEEGSRESVEIRVIQ
jgi:hypothetical protein